MSHIKRYYKNKVTSETLDGLIKLVDRENPYGTGIGVPEKINGYNYNMIYINIENYPVYRKSVYSVFVHESYHTVERIANQIGLSRKEDCAYLAGDIMEQCLPLIKDAERRTENLD